MPSTRTSPTLALALLFVSCAGSSSAVLRSPVSHQCVQAELHGCDEISDGVLLYVDGHQAEALPKLTAAAAENPPEQIEKFATLLETLDTVPGASKYTASIQGVVATLTIEASKRAKVSAPDKGARDKEPATHPTSHRKKRSFPLRTVTADTDPYQLRGGLELPPAEAHDWCTQVFGVGALCGTIAKGPLYLTDAVPTGASCRGQVLGVMSGGQLNAEFESPLRVHGARIFIPRGSILVFAQRPPPAEEELGTSEGAPADEPEQVRLEETAPEWSCRLYWSGFIPYATEARGQESWTKESGF